MKLNSDRAAGGLFIAAIAVVAVLYGTLAARWNWFPAPQLDLAERTIGDAKAYWKNDLGLEPTRHLVPARTPRAPDGNGFRMYHPEAAAPGFTLIAGLSPEQEVSAHAVTLYDEAGRQLFRWPVDYGLLDPGGKRPQNVMLHGMEVFPDGSLAVAFDTGDAIARIDACGRPIWAVKGSFHHAITADGEGALYTWRDDDIVKLDAATGAILWTLNMWEEVIPAGDGQEGIFSIRTESEVDAFRYEGDPLHTNDVEPLRPEVAAAFPMFEAGDLLISLRNLNLVAVIAPDGLLRWWRHGPWHKQHDPDFEPDGTITVFDNGTGLDRSRILRIDPLTNETSVVLQGSDGLPFYSWRRGKHQVLPNGNLLVTEAERGRVFEADPQGRLIWERELPWDAQRNLIVTEARHVAADFFQPGAPACDGSVTVAAYR